MRRLIIWSSEISTVLALMAGPATAQDLTVGATPAPLTLSLKDATSRALLESHKIKSVREAFETADHQLAATRSGFLPTLNFETSVGTLHDRQPISGEAGPPETPRDRNLYDAELVLRQSLFSGFHDVNDYRAKRAGRDEAEWQLKSIGLEISLAVIEQYFAIQMGQAELSAERQVATLREQQLKEIQNRGRQGRATDLEVLEAEYAVKAQDPTIKTLERDIERRSLKLARLVGLPLNQSFRLTDELTNIGAVLGSTSLPTLGDAYSAALKENPELKRAAATREKLEWEQARDSAKHLPDLAFEARAGYLANLRNEFGTNDSTQYSGMLKLTVPLFSGLSSFSDREANASRLNQAIEEQALTREDLLQNLIDAFRDLDLANQQIAVQQKNLDLTKRAVSNAKTLYHDGRATASSVLDSYSRDLSARRGYVEALFSRITALAKIRALTAP